MTLKLNQSLKILVTRIMQGTKTILEHGAVHKINIEYTHTLSQVIQELLKHQMSISTALQVEPLLTQAASSPLST